MKAILVPGTWATHGNIDGEWFHPQSRFVAMLGANGIEMVCPERPFTWCASVDGVGRGDHADWKASGANLYAYVVPPLCPDKRIRPEDTRVLAHSHGAQVVLYAAAMGLKIRSLITVCSPVRADMDDVTRAARKNIAHWIHLRADRWDWMQLFGSLFDGRVGIYRSQPWADENHIVPDIAHSRLLSDPKYLPLWKDQQWLEHLKW